MWVLLPRGPPLAAGRPSTLSCFTSTLEYRKTNPTTMMILILLFQVLGLASGISRDFRETLLEKKERLVAEINDIEKNTWKAKINKRFYSATTEDIKLLLGTKVRGVPGYVEQEIDTKTSFLTAEAIPESFDARTAWPHCAAIIGHVRDQSSCGSCWAFGSTEAFNDRHCISTGDTKTLFSPEDTVSCCKGLTCNLSMGCDGGQPVNKNALNLYSPNRTF